MATLHFLVNFCFCYFAWFNFQTFMVFHCTSWSHLPSTNHDSFSSYGRTMPITTILMEKLSQSAWSFLGLVVSRATDTVLTFSRASARIYQRSGGLPLLSHSLVHLILSVPAINTLHLLFISGIPFWLVNWRRLENVSDFDYEKIPQCQNSEGGKRPMQES